MGGRWASSQRVPVRIAIDKVPPGMPLVSGLTATVTIRNGTDGESRTLFQRKPLSLRRACRTLEKPSLTKGLHWVKRRNTRCEQMFSGLPPKADIDRAHRDGLHSKSFITRNPIYWSSCVPVSLTTPRKPSAAIASDLGRIVLDGRSAPAGMTDRNMLDVVPCATI